MFGRAVAERGVVVTEDYANDPIFPHAAGPDRVVADIGIRSMVVAPLRHGDEVYGALGTFSRQVARLRPRPDRARPLAGRPCRRGHRQLVA